MRKIVCLFAPISKKQRSVRGLCLNINRACSARFSYLLGMAAVGFLITGSIPFPRPDKRRKENIRLQNLRENATAERTRGG